MNKLKELKARISRWANKKLLADPSVVLVNATEYAQLRLELSTLRQKALGPHIQPATKYELVQKELGSYIPNLEPLDTKSDEFKNALGRLCREVNLSPEFQYLLTHMKQDQVNLSLFQERKSEDWVLGSINGVYIVEEQIRLLGDNYQDRLSKGLIQPPKPETPTV